MTDQRMVVVDGVRYRLEDAERLGLVSAPPAAAEVAPKTAAKKRAPSNKSRTPANKEGHTDAPE